jgi:hypothetical protein
MPYKNKKIAKQKARERYLQKKQEILAKCKAYYETQKEQHRSSVKKWEKKNKKRMDAYYARYRKENTQKIRQKNKRYKDRMREECFEHYGNKCQCCGEHRKEFFAMHHIEGGGRQHRLSEKMLQQGGGIYLYLKRRGYPKNFEIQCHNCNAARGYYGYCPHEREREAELLASSMVSPLVPRNNP